MNKFKKVSFALAMASEGNPVLTTITIMLFYVMINMLECQIERLIFGERFEHWLDPIIVLSCIAYSAYLVWACAVYNTQEK